MPAGSRLTPATRPRPSRQVSSGRTDNRTAVQNHALNALTTGSNPARNASNLSKIERLQGAKTPEERQEILNTQRPELAVKPAIRPPNETAVTPPKEEVITPPVEDVATTPDKEPVAEATKEEIVIPPTQEPVETPGAAVPGAEGQGAIESGSKSGDVNTSVSTGVSTGEESAAIGSAETSLNGISVNPSTGQVTGLSSDPRQRQIQEDYASGKLTRTQAAAKLADIAEKRGAVPKRTALTPSTSPVNTVSSTSQLMQNQMAVLSEQSPTTVKLDKLAELFEKLEARQTQMEERRLERAADERDREIAQAETFRQENDANADALRDLEIERLEKDNNDRLDETMRHFAANGSFGTDEMGNDTPETIALKAKLRADAAKNLERARLNTDIKHQNSISKNTMSQQKSIADAEDAYFDFEDEISAQQQQRFTELESSILGEQLEVQKEAREAEQEQRERKEESMEDIEQRFLNGELSAQEALGFLNRTALLKGATTAQKDAANSMGENAFRFIRFANLLGGFTKLSDNETAAVKEAFMDGMSRGFSNADMVDQVTGFSEVGNGANKPVASLMRDLIRSEGDLGFMGGIAEFMTQGNTRQAITDIEARLMQGIDTKFSDAKTVESAVKKARPLVELLKDPEMASVMGFFDAKTFKWSRQWLDTVKSDRVRAKAIRLQALLTDFAKGPRLQFMGVQVTEEEQRFFDGIQADVADQPQDALEKVRGALDGMMVEHNTARGFKNLPVLSQGQIIDPNGRIEAYEQAALRRGYEMASPETRKALDDEFGDFKSPFGETDEPAGGDLQSSAPTEPQNQRVAGDLQESDRPNVTGKIPDDLSNPGNIRPGGLADSLASGFVNTPSGKFLIFDSPEAGFKALQQDIGAKLAGNSPAIRRSLGRDAKTLREVLSVYAPPSENDTDQYVLDIASFLGVSPDIGVEELQPMLEKLARAIARKEGFTNHKNV